MANVIISSVISDMVSRAISLLTNKFRDQRSSEAKLRMIHHMVIKIQSVVEEATARQITNQALLYWLSELIDGVYQGRYMLDMFRYGSVRTPYPTEGDEDSRSSVSSFNPAKRLRVAVSSTTKTMLFQEKDVIEIDNVLANLQLISENLKAFIMLLGSHPQQVHRPITTTLYVDCQMFGRHVEREQIINFLLHENGPSTQKLSILPVIGDTGVGKTTLVQQICVDERVRNYFSTVMLFDSYFTHSMGNTTVWNWDDPARVLNATLRGSRFLLIFLNIDQQHVQQLKVLLPMLSSGKHGSKIIVTSDNNHIASIGTVNPISLRDLPQAEYWFFFKALAFGSSDLEEDQRLMTIGRAISRRLKGSFLGAKIVGGLLRANPSPKFWLKVANCDAWKLEIYGNGLAYINEVISHLPLPHMKKHRISVTAILASNCKTRLELQNLHHRDSVVTASDREESKDGGKPYAFDVLLSRSVFPLYSLYLVAHCTMH